MHLSVFAAAHPDRLAYVMAGSGETVSYGQLERRSRQAARLFRASGLRAGDGVAIFMDNNARFLEVAWAAERIGLYYTAVSSRLTAGEVEYIVRDSGARILVAAAALRDRVQEVAPRIPGVVLLMVNGTVGPFDSYEEGRDRQDDGPLDDERPGGMMLYSSGTTGQPKGVRPPLRSAALCDPDPILRRRIEMYRMAEDTVYLCPAPLYHAAPLGWSMAVHRVGGTVIVMEHFDPSAVLRLIERHRVTHGQFVPTHFVRMLKLPSEERSAHDLGSLRLVFHAAAPCPVPVKEAMLAWWGPIIHEYYAGTEGNGQTAIGPEEWLSHKGSVGRATLGELRICDDHGNVVPPRTEGMVYFAGGPPLNYHNAPEKAAENTDTRGWTTLGDVGWVDEDGYLYLTDRKSFMIISGGVNIYPQEIENLLVGHPRVMDAAVVGAPDEDMGERVVAVVQPVDWADAGEALRAELMAFARAGLSHVKAPRSIDFMRELPRHPTGKLYKRLVRDAYRDGDRAGLL